MRSKYQYEVFISFNQEDEQKVRPIYEKMTNFGLRAFWSVRKLPTGVPFPPELEKALRGSQHFALYCSEKAMKSEWVNKELQLFKTSCHDQDEENRRIYVLLDPECDQKHVAPEIDKFQRPDSPDELIAALVRALERDYKRTEDELEQKQRTVAEAQSYYRYNRFWGPIAANQDVHIFTCGRDISHSSSSSRGYGGRTNIDMWDYRAVLDINRFFASNYPNVRVTIEDPMSKLQSQGLDDMVLLADHIAYMRSTLMNEDCIIIGSPDVSDYAEIVLAQIHQIKPYTEGRLKRKGFVLIKEKKLTKSSFYWQIEGQEEEGAIQIMGPSHYEYFPNITAKEGSLAKMYGILVVANNPFCEPKLPRKIIILSGFSGVATNAIAKILTDEKYLREFFKLDDKFADTERNIEALIGVEYSVGGDFENRDTRQIMDYEHAITFERLVEI